MPEKTGCQGCPAAGYGPLACLSRAQRARLTAAAVPHVFRAGETVFHEGTAALGVHCVRSGSLKLSHRIRSGDQVVVGIRRAGDLVGYRAVLTGLPFAVMAETLEPAVICTIPGEAFTAVVRDDVDLAIALLKQMAHEYQDAERELVERLTERVEKRVTRVLSWLARGEGPRGWMDPQRGVTLSREEMATLVGTTPETLSRTLHRLARRGIVEVDRTRLRILDPGALQD